MKKIQILSFILVIILHSQVCGDEPRQLYNTELVYFPDVKQEADQVKIFLYRLDLDFKNKKIFNLYKNCKNMSDPVYRVTLRPSFGKIKSVEITFKGNKIEIHSNSYSSPLGWPTDTATDEEIIHVLPMSPYGIEIKKELKK